MSTAILEASELAVAGKKRVRLCSREDLVAGSGVVAWHEGHQIAIFYLPGRPEAAGESSNRPEAVGELSTRPEPVGELSTRPEAVGELYAVDNHDPFSSANVIGRGIIGDLAGELVVASPIYKHHFRLRDGQCLEDPGQCLRHWSVAFDGDDVMLREPRTIRA
ncbi:MAG: hypothetical protein CMN25_10165 [Salinicola sp.]|uniref:nitrite reductase (NAD(P)H) small subunit family protein n=1 Tax=uncultured Salinicola sp. TaxID=1193542 RepID=UPI000C98318E|nr:nitrite reductase (NAD(P)H) small subunit family protein [uncultured Salinicola sp.]MAM57687.1 hypothetical protein [Salinicola sp.]|tara:strand:+ start:258 stop:746 length:489 start_codon:yes stop_codon:yes gene_type:complete